MAFNWNKFPWTNLHDLNLDWIIQKVKELVNRVVVLENEYAGVEADTLSLINREINELTTGAGDLEIDKTGTVRISGGTVDLSNTRTSTDLDMGGHRIINVGAPVSGNDAVNKTYVDSLEGGGIVLRGTAVFTPDGRISEVTGIDYSSVAAAALANVNILLVLTASNVEETYIVMRYVGKKQLATSGSNRYRYAFIGSNSISGSLGGLPDTGNVYGLDFNEGDDPMRQKDTYFISRGVCDFHVNGTASQGGALESVTFKAGYSKADFDNLLAQGARVRLVVEIPDETRFFNTCGTGAGTYAFSGMHKAGDGVSMTEMIVYNGTTFEIH